MKQIIITLLISILSAQLMMAQTALDKSNPDHVEISIPKSVYSLYNSGAIGRDPRDGISYQRSRNNIELYPVHTDAMKYAGIPQGELLKGTFKSSSVYPGVSYEYAVYVPAQYDGSNPANLIVFQDGGSYISAEADVDAPTVLDNLIARKDIPVTIALFIWPGDIGPGLPIYGGSGNRSIEYDSVDDLYARFLIDELIPETLSDYQLSQNPADNCIYGVSSSANSALAVAWHRNDRFGCVISCTGSFVNIRGGHIWPFAIRSHEKKQMKIFMTVGEIDLDIIFGDWLTANRDVRKALEYKEYDYMYVEHKSGHTGKVMRQLLPGVLRWMWNDVKFNPENCIVTFSENK